MGLINGKSSLVRVMTWHLLFPITFHQYIWISLIISQHLVHVIASWQTEQRSITPYDINTAQWFNSLWPSSITWRHRSGSAWAQVMASCLTAPSLYLKQSRVIIIHWHSPESNFTRSTHELNPQYVFGGYIFYHISISPRNQCVKSLIARFMWPTWGPPGADRTQVRWGRQDPGEVGPTGPRWSGADRTQVKWGRQDPGEVGPTGPRWSGADRTQVEWGRQDPGEVGPTGPRWGGADRTQVGPMLATWTLLSGVACPQDFRTM